MILPTQNRLAPKRMGYRLSGLWLAGIFAWNAVFGTTGGFLLCLHSGGDGHLVSNGKAHSCCHATGFEHPAAAEVFLAADCPECTDIAVQGVEIPALRKNEISTQKIEPATLRIWGARYPSHTPFPNNCRSLRGRSTREIGRLGATAKVLVIRLL